VIFRIFSCTSLASSNP